MNALPGRSGYLPETHKVRDVLAKDLDVVFCGTALGRRSAAERAYYAHPTNKFWKALYEAGFTPTRLDPRQYADVLSYKLGLTDLCKTAYGNDAELPKGAFDVPALRQKIVLFQPRYLAFTSLTGAQAVVGRPLTVADYGMLPETIGATQLFVLSSPSGSSSRYWNAGIWRELALFAGRS